MKTLGPLGASGIRSGGGGVTRTDSLTGATGLALPNGGGNGSPGGSSGGGVGSYLSIQQTDHFLKTVNHFGLGSYHKT